MRPIDTFLLICLAVFAVYLIVISVFAVHQTKRDKQLSNIPKESSNYWRIPEFQLMLISALGGSFAMYATMKSIRHKTQHPKFMIGIPVIMLLQIALAVFLVWLRFS